MKGNAEIIGHLNQVLMNELTAINQYFLHARMLGNWGLKELEAYEYKDSLDEMKHADTLVQRILFLEGLPNLQELNRLRIGENVEEVLAGDLALEVEARAELLEAISACEQVRDYVSRDIFTDILEHEEAHIDWLETQLGLIQRVGIQNYIQSQMEGGEG